MCLRAPAECEERTESGIRTGPFRVASYARSLCRWFTLLLAGYSTFRTSGRYSRGSIWARSVLSGRAYEDLGAVGGACAFGSSERASDER